MTKIKFKVMKMMKITDPI